MSTSEQKIPSEINNIPLIRRISEILEEKGEEYSIRKFSTRLAMSRETFRLIMVGERHVTPSEVEDISNGLGLTVDRLKQMDTFKQQQELELLFNADKRTKPMMLRAHAIATDLVEMALGITEKGFALHNLAKVQYIQKQFDHAHAIWLKALEYAQQLDKKYDEKKLLNIVTANLMVTYTIRKEYSNVEEFLLKVEEVFAEDPLIMGMAQYTRMKVQEERGNLESAKKLAYLSHDYLERTGSNEQISHGLINIAHYEYRLGNYETSAALLSKATSIAKDFSYILILAVKEYAKSLMQLRDYKAVIQLIEKHSDFAKDYPDYWGKLQIMFSRATDDPSYADTITNDPNISLNVRFYACKSLMEFYSLKRDFESVVRYYEKSRIFSNTKSEYLNEGGF